MGIEEWLRSKAAEKSWSQGFKNAAMPGDGLFVSEYVKCYRKNQKSLWAEYHGPYTGIRLIAFELNPTIAPPRVMCRVWLYGDQDELWDRFSKSGAPKLLSSESVRWMDVPPGDSWKGQLKEINATVKGIQYDAKHPILSTIPENGSALAVEAQLEETLGSLAEQFLAWVSAVYQRQVLSDAYLPGSNDAPDSVKETSPTLNENVEGEWQQVTVTLYERNRTNRKACLDHYGPSCQACGMSFGDVYGELGTDFIHVHHEIALHTMGGAQNVDPIKDMKPLCPNCHSMVHRIDPPMPVMKLRRLLDRKTTHSMEKTFSRNDMFSKKGIDPG
jgi:hypothetical protein